MVGGGRGENRKAIQVVCENRKWRDGRVVWLGSLYQGDTVRKIPWQAAGANRREFSRERERERETEEEIEVECVLALPVTTYLKFRFSWDVHSPGSELKQ